MAGEFIIVKSGLVNAVSASYPGGVSIKLTSFRLGTGTAYEPNPDTDQTLRGVEVFGGPISSYVRMGDGSLLVTCVLPAEVGPFDFGEIGIYTDSGALFALCCLPEQITKTSSMNSGFGTTYTFNGLIKVGSSPIIIETTGAPLGFPVQYVPAWSMLEPAPISGAPLYMSIVSEVDSKGNYGMALRKNDGTWAVGGGFISLSPVATITGVAGDKSWVTIALTAWAQMCPSDPQFVRGLKSGFLIKAPNSYFCMATGQIGGSNVQFTFNQPFTKGNLGVGQTLQIWSSQSV